MFVSINRQSPDQRTARSVIYSTTMVRTALDSCEHPRVIDRAIHGRQWDQINTVETDQGMTRIGKEIVGMKAATTLCFVRGYHQHDLCIEE